MSKLSIVFKLLTVLSVLVLSLAGVGVVAIGTMQNINSHTVEIAESWLPSVRALGSIRADVNELRVALRLHLMQDTLEGKEAAEKRLASLRERIEQTRKVYEPLITSAEERSIYGQWTTAWGEYLNGVQDVMALSRKSPGKFPTEANELLQTKVAKMAQASDPLLTKDIELNNRGAELETKQAADSYATIFRVLVGIIIASVAIAIGAAYYLVRDVSQGIASIIRPMQSLGEGDLSAEVPHRGEKTEIGSMADALQIFKEALIAKRAADEAARLDAEAKIERGRRVDAITRKFETMIGEVVGTVSSASTELEASASTLTNTARRGQELATVVAAASEEASTNVQAVASASEELSSSITEISRRVQDSARMAAEAVEQASRTNERVNELSQAAARIGDVVELINTIAGQTNLLALNATIEAARAGEAGKGFAVVASEVKSLAHQTSKATEEITSHVASIQGITAETRGAIDAISKTLSEISSIMSGIEVDTAQQRNATQDITRSAQDAARGTLDVSNHIVQITSTSAETGRMAAEARDSAVDLSQQAETLKREVDEFIVSVRAS